MDRVRKLGTDRRLAVCFLGVIAMMAVFADALLLLNGHEPPGGLLAVAGGCIGALATLVTAAPTQDRP